MQEHTKSMVSWKKAAQVSSERCNRDAAEQPSSNTYRSGTGPCLREPNGPTRDDQTLTARPQHHKGEVQQSGEHVLHPHGGKPAGKARRKLCLGLTRFEGTLAHSLSWQHSSNGAHHSPAEELSAPTRQHQFSPSPHPDTPETIWTS